MSKVVLVTGASSGIGLSIANYLVEKKFKVYGTSRNPRDADNYLFNLIKLEVTNVDSIESAITSIIDFEGRIDILINNAGKGITGPIEDTSTDEMRSVFNLNFFGAIDVMKGVLPFMRSNKSGMIINITSIAGYMGLPYRGIYSASKGALELVTEAMSMEVKKMGIHVINVAPGDFATNIAQGRHHTPVLENSAYKKDYQHNLNLMNDHVDSGSDPQEMANAVYKIIQSKNPKIHYKIGSFMQKFSIILKRILPDRVYEKILMNHFDL